MRLIDSDELLKNDVGRIMGFRECDIKNAPTVNAIPISVIGDIKAEIIDLAEGWNGMQAKNVPLGAVLKVIDKHTSGKE